MRRKLSVKHVIALLNDYTPAERRLFRSALESFHDVPGLVPLNENDIAEILRIVQESRDKENNDLKTFYLQQHEHELKIIEAAHQIDMIVGVAEGAAMLRPDRRLLGQLLAGYDQRLADRVTLFNRLANEADVSPDHATIHWLGQFTDALSTATGETCDGGKEIRRLHALNSKKKLQELFAAIARKYDRGQTAANRGHDLIAETALGVMRDVATKEITTDVAHTTHAEIQKLAEKHPDDDEVKAALKVLDDASKPGAATQIRRKVKDIVDSYQKRSQKVIEGAPVSG